MDDQETTRARIRALRNLELEQDQLNRCSGEGLAPHLRRRKLLQAQALVRHHTVFSHDRDDGTKAQGAHEEVDRLMSLIGVDPETVPDPDGSLPAQRRAANLDQHRASEEAALQELANKITLIEEQRSGERLAKDRRKIDKELGVLQREHEQRSTTLATLSAADMCSECATVADTHGFLASGPHPDGSGLVQQSVCPAWPGPMVGWAKAWQILIQSSSTPPVSTPPAGPPPPPRPGTTAWLRQRVAELEAELAQHRTTAETSHADTSAAVDAQEL